MKKNLILAVVLAVLSMVFTNCQKEDSFESQNNAFEQMSMFTVNYIVDGVTNRVTLFGEENLDKFIKYTMSLVSQGHSVRVFVDELYYPSLGAKDSVTTTKDSEEEAEEWVREKVKEGYVAGATLSQDGTTYICIANK